MITYREETSLSNNDFIVRTNEDGTESWIPVDETNSEYQAYLNPAEQSTPNLPGNADKL
jgi:hypothetical protein